MRSAHVLSINDVGDIAVSLLFFPRNTWVRANSESTETAFFKKKKNDPQYHYVKCHLVLTTENTKTIFCRSVSVLSFFAFKIKVEMV